MLDSETVADLAELHERASALKADVASLRGTLDKLALRIDRLNAGRVDGELLDEIGARYNLTRGRVVFGLFREGDRRYGRRIDGHITGLLGETVW